MSLVDQLIELRAVRQDRSSTDRRAKIIELTARGRELLAAVERIARSVDEELRTGLTEKARAALGVLISELDLIDQTTGSMFDLSAKELPSGS